MDLILTKIAGLLNSRPIFANATGLVSISDVLHPRISSAEQFDMFEDDLLQKDAVFKQIWSIFCEELIAGQLSKPGKKSFQEDPSIEVGSVIMVLFPSRNLWKYGKVLRAVSRYCFEILLKYGRSYRGHQVIDRCKIIVLFKPKNNESQKEEVLVNEKPTKIIEKLWHLPVCIKN